MAKRKKNELLGFECYTKIDLIDFIWICSNKGYNKQNLWNMKVSKLIKILKEEAHKDDIQK